MAVSVSVDLSDYEEALELATHQLQRPAHVLAEAIRAGLPLVRASSQAGTPLPE